MRTEYTYDHYQKYDEITAKLKKYAEQYPDYCRLESIAETREGRQVWLLSITKLSTGDFSEKPAYGVHANIHAGEVTGTECAMYFIDTLMTNKDDEQIDWLLSHFTIYAIPRITPDGAEYYLTTPYSLRSVNVMYPYTEVQPGIQPEDLDGDGVIRQMRIKNPDGPFKIYDKDPRIMVKREPHEMTGEFYDVFSEGVIEKYAESGELTSAPMKFGYDYNRNYPVNWQPEHVQRGAGDFAEQHPETKGLADYLYAHKNLCFELNFHTSGGQILFPPGHIHTKDAVKEDIDHWRTIGKIANKETGYVVLNLLDDYVGEAAGSMGIAGDYDTFASYAMGIMDFTCECWNLTTRSGHPETWPRPEHIPDEEEIAIVRDALKWLEENNNGEGFLNWTKFNHPQLGEVEIGGFDAKNCVQNPPKQFLQQETEKLTNFLLRCIRTLPRLEIEHPSVTAVREGIYKVEADIVNAGYLPTSVLREAEKIEVAKPVRVTFTGAELVSGEAETEIGHLSGFSGTKAVYTPFGGIVADRTPSSEHMTWVVAGNAGDTVVITASCPRAGKASACITLKGE